jgi:2-dehydro-3-deoxygluconokinase
MMGRWRPMIGRGQVIYYRGASAGAQLCPTDVPLDRVREARVVHTTGITPALGPGPRAAVLAATAAARADGVPVSVDLNYRAALWSREEAAPVLARLTSDADVVFAGLDEACLVTGLPGPEQSDPGSLYERAHEAALALRALGPGDAVIKLGRAGCVAHFDGRAYELSAPAVEVVDTVGAGDAFVSGFLAELIAGEPPERCLATALAAGALAVTVPGDWEGNPRREDLALLETSEPVVR